MPTNLNSSLVNGAESRSLLYVEDNLLLRVTVSRLLGRAGYGVQTAEDGVAALLKIDEATAPFDIVLTDQEMPRMNGLSFVQALRKQKFAGLIVVYSTALTPHAQQEFAAMAVNGILTKGTRADIFVEEFTRLTKLPEVIKD